MSVYQIGTYPGFLPGIPSAIEHSGDHIASLTFPQLLKLFCPFQHLHRNKAPQMPYAVKEGCLAIGSGKHKSGVIHRPEGISGSVNTERPLVFMDPPYGTGSVGPTLKALIACSALASAARIVIEHSHREQLELRLDSLALADQRRFGKTLVSFVNPVL